MSASTELPVLNSQSASRHISRREAAQVILSGLAAGILVPFASAAHPIHKHLLNGALLDSADARLSTENAKPLFLSAQQFAALEVLSEAIVPGSRKAQSASFIDLLLSVDTQNAQEKLLASLSAFESASQYTFHAGLASISPAQLHELLTSLSAPDSADRKHFNHLKDWVSGAYYSSEIGMRELGWTPDRVFSAFPSCSHPEGHS
jgi:gluconate 2-dehydrogenase subunit 3-like protein